MALEKSSRAKTQTLSLRLDPKTRFVLEFIAKVNRHSITTVVEEAIRKAGGETAIMCFVGDPKTWADYWDISEGVRIMRMLDDSDMPSDYEDDELREFLRQHIEFFSETYELKNPDRINVDILWPGIAEYLDTWRETKRSEPFSAGGEMAAQLQSAGINPPKWPRTDKAPPVPRIKLSGGFPRDLDDEVPF